MSQRRSLRPSLLPAAVAVAATLSSACSGLKPFRVHAKSDPPTSPASLSQEHLRMAPMIPFALAREDDYVVRVVAGKVTCSGTLIAEDQVLTAHHCVSERDNYGEFMNRDVEPRSIQVELGGDDLPWGEVGVKAIVAPPCGHAAGVGDIAVLVLERKLIGVTTAEPRLTDPPTAGERIEPVGFGRCAMSSDAIRRKQRTGGAIKDILDSRFRLTASICPGDSGGPAMSSNPGEVVGVISRAAMDGSEHTAGRAEFTRLDRWRPVFAAAKLISDGASPAEVPPVACP
ncbi:MAG: S1 family peptidase [Polyangiaceae bacterium]